MNWFSMNGCTEPRCRATVWSIRSKRKAARSGLRDLSNVSPGFEMSVPLYLDFNGQLVAVGSIALAGSAKSREFRSNLPRRPRRVLLNAEQDVLASEVVVNGK